MCVFFLGMIEIFFIKKITQFLIMEQILSEKEIEGYANWLKTYELSHEEWKEQNL